ncbi:multidrug transporter [Vreelandella andesensis]|uniref:Multidrug transporter n=1 Tax=Vreelandella andesensis TaxID=447567 RepID=A0A3S0YWR7_9GAMM|nr:SapC family protein [Halomonas andesensis]RUR31472.1 multidrug transporter [Halomonas andesensis]
MANAAHWVPLNVKHHGGLMWQRFTAYHFAQHITQASLAATELRHAAACFPIGFNQTTQGWQAVALLGLRDSQNLMVDSQGRWRAAYVPAVLRSHPFGLSADTPETLCIDQHSPFVVSRLDAEPFFNQHGELASFPQHVLAFLQQRETGCQRVAQQLEALANANLLTPWLPEGYQGSAPLYQIDEPAWKALSTEQMGLFWQLDAVPLVYAQLISQQQLGVLRSLFQRPTTPPLAESPSRPLSEWQEAFSNEERYQWPDPS